MADAAGVPTQPSRARKIIATLIVAITVMAVWKVIDYRTQPPPPHPIGEIQPSDG